jgi:hypothetical protein
MVIADDFLFLWMEMLSLVALSLVIAGGLLDHRVFALFIPVAPAL